MQKLNILIRGKKLTLSLNPQTTVPQLIKFLQDHYNIPCCQIILRRNNLVLSDFCCLADYHWPSDVTLEADVTPTMRFVNVIFKGEVHQYLVLLDHTVRDLLAMLQSTLFIQHNEIYYGYAPKLNHMLLKLDGSFLDVNCLIGDLKLYGDTCLELIINVPHIHPGQPYLQCTPVQPLPKFISILQQTYNYSSEILCTQGDQLVPSQPNEIEMNDSNILSLPIPKRHSSKDLLSSRSYATDSMAEMKADSSLESERHSWMMPPIAFPSLSNDHSSISDELAAKKKCDSSSSNEKWMTTMDTLMKRMDALESHNQQLTAEINRLQSPTTTQHEEMIKNLQQSIQTLTTEKEEYHTKWSQLTDSVQQLQQENTYLKSVLHKQHQILTTLCRTLYGDLPSTNSSEVDLPKEHSPMKPLNDSDDSLSCTSYEELPVLPHSLSTLDNNENNNLFPLNTENHSNSSSCTSLTGRSTIVLEHSSTHSRQSSSSSFYTSKDILEAYYKTEQYICNQIDKNGSANKNEANKHSHHYSNTSLNTIPPTFTNSRSSHHRKQSSSDSIPDQTTSFVKSSSSTHKRASSTDYSSSEPSSLRSPWTCQVCGSINYDDYCFICENPRSQQSATPLASELFTLFQSTLLSSDEKYTLYSWLFENNRFHISYHHQTTQLIYKASTLPEGFSSSLFHYYIDNKPDVLILIKTQDHMLYGGFTHIGFTPSALKKKVPDPYAFIFLLHDSIRRNQSPYIAYPLSNTSFITYNKNYGPIFGDRDLIVCNHCNTQRQSSLNLFSSYCCYETANHSFFDTPFTSLLIEDIEVFQIDHFEN